jgi:two-component system, OmpR family, KDP operon response regulator KdpE
MRNTDPIKRFEPVTVLLIDDDSFLRHALGVSLGARGYVVEEAKSGEEGIQAISQKPIDLVLLDVNMSGIDGVETCRRIRASSANAGILMLTVSDEQDKIIAALEAGADDYVTKPIRFGELVARMQAVDRRIRGEEPFSMEVLRIGQLELDPIYRTLKKAGREIRLSQTEFSLLAYLMRHPGVPVSRTELLRAVWGGEYVRELERLRTYCKLLRQKIEDDSARPEYIVTEREFGYSLQDPARPRAPQDNEKKE